MPLITDWLMVVITAIYVIATVFICVFNAKSAKATRAQVAESQRQFEESKRLQMMPYLDFNDCNSDCTFSPPEYRILIDDYRSSDGWLSFSEINLSFENVGNGSLRELTSYFYRPNGVKLHKDFPITALAAGTSKSVHFVFDCPNNEDTPDAYYVVIEFQYKDMLNYTYMQNMQVNLIFDKEECFNGSPLNIASITLSEAKPLNISEVNTNA